MAAEAAASPEAVVQVRRTFAAPREKVLQAWTDPKMMTKWFTRGGEDWPLVKIVEVDLRVGGRYRVESDCKGTIYRIFGTYRELRPPERLVFTWTWEGADFEESVVTVEFRQLGQSAFTEVSLKHERLPEKERKSHEQGWIQCLELLEKTL